MHDLDKVMRVLVEGGFGGRLHTVFGVKRVYLKDKSKQCWSKGWRRDEEKEEREHLPPDGLVKHL